MTMDPLATVGWNMRQPEIEELRAENERLMLADRQWADHVKRLAEENERLRAALEQLDDACDRNIGGLREGALSDARRNAKAALGR